MIVDECTEIEKHCLFSCALAHQIENAMIKGSRPVHISDATTYCRYGMDMHQIPMITKCILHPVDTTIIVKESTRVKPWPAFCKGEKAYETNRFCGTTCQG
jgi:hypothetical protein